MGSQQGRYAATPGHHQPLSVQLNGTSGHARQRPATSQKCLLSSRSRVRVALGALVRVVSVLDTSAGSPFRTATTELVYRHEIRPALTQDADVMDKNFR